MLRSHYLGQCVSCTYLGTQEFMQDLNSTVFGVLDTANTFLSRILDITAKNAPSFMCKFKFFLSRLLSFSDHYITTLSYSFGQVF